MNSHRLNWLRRVCAAAIFAGTQLASASTAVVYPTGSVALDVANVQAAIDAGGTVLLKATNVAGQPAAFNFGSGVDASGVNINASVSMLGEHVGRNRTTINGGFIPILGVAPVKSTIQGIDFDGPIDSPVVIIASTGVNFIGNQIRNVIPAALCAPPCTFTEIEGILVSGYNDPLNAVTGKVRVADNVFELSGGSFANGMQFDEVSADIEVSGNTVKFIESDGIIQTIGILLFRSHGRGSVIGNDVTMGPGDPDAFPVGIFVGGHPEARYLILGNTVTTNHPNSDGIDIVGIPNSGATQHAIVQGNDVVIHSTLATAGGLGFDGAVQNSLMAANRVTGTSGNAIQILGLDSTLTADSNLALGNDISRLAASAGDVYFGSDSDGNLFVGNCKTYVDLGIANRILCGHALGQVARAPSVNAPPMANRPGPMIDLLGGAIRPAGLDGMRTRAAR